MGYKLLIKESACYRQQLAKLVVYYSFSTISYFFRTSTWSALGSNFFLAASLARSSATVMFRLRPDEFVVAAVPFACAPLWADGGDDGVVVAEPLARGVGVTVGGATTGTIGEDGADGVALGACGGGKADAEVTDGMLMISDFGNNGDDDGVV